MRFINTCIKVMKENNLRLRLLYPASESQSEVTQSCLTLCDPMDCSLPGSSVHGIFQAIVLEWIVISFSRGSSRPRDQTWVSRILDRCFTVWATREVQQGSHSNMKEKSKALQTSKTWENSAPTNQLSNKC